MIKDFWHSEQQLPDYPENMAAMLNLNADKFLEHPIYQEPKNGKYLPISWTQIQKDITYLQYSLIKIGFKKGDRIAVISRNRQEMLTLELAVMSMGAVFVPIFAGYPAPQIKKLVDFCQPKLIAVADQIQYDKLNQPSKYDNIIHFDPVETKHTVNLITFETLIQPNTDTIKIIGDDITKDHVCLMMYTSGTMGKPKCVMLTHQNILSQQAAMKILWNLSESDRILSYLPWHHSFGGIYEKYSAIYNGAVLSLENSYGKNIDTLLDNWNSVRPTIFFSVPRIYQEIVTKVMQDKKIEKMIFHDELRFIFTAAAPLPHNISTIFEKRNIPIYEGWGLTETSPCCTVTDASLKREPGVVGKPIPGISIKLSEEKEIMVKGPNVMTGYYNNPEETDRVLTDDGWFYTGDVGEFVEYGLKLISRKDRIFKLSNAEKVIPTEIENLIVKDCPFLSHAFVAGSGYDYPVILLFPNKKMLNKITNSSDIKPECKCPDGFSDFAQCLGHCIKKMNDNIETKYAHIKGGMLVDYELSIENEELTPSMKLAPNVVGKVFKANIDWLYGNAKEPLDEDKIYIINVEE